MNQTLNKLTVEALQPGTTRFTAWDAKITGFGVRVMPSGAKSFVYVYRPVTGREGRPQWFTIGRFGDYTVEQARQEAAKLQGDVLRGHDPMRRLKDQRSAAEVARNEPKTCVETIVIDFIERYAKRQNRRWNETKRILCRHIIPAWGKRQITDVTRADVNELLDSIEDKSGAPMANAVLAQVRKMFNWHAARDDKFNSPIVKGMARISPKKIKRDRVLSDDEIRVLWQALDASAPPYRQLVRFLLLTAQRRDEAAQAQKTELSREANGPNLLWVIPAERYKTGKPNSVPLTTAALLELESLPELPFAATNDCDVDYLFTTNGKTPYSGFSKSKARLDAEMERIMRKRAGAAPKKGQTLLKPWRLHDLRRTAKTLMQRAGIRPDISERVLGHVIAGVEGIYDQYAYLPEKRHALNALSLELQRILAGSASDNVVHLRAATG